MAKTGSRKKENFKPALTPEAREAQLISLAYDCAEEQMRKGTASSQMITHFLKQGSIRAQIDLEKAKAETEFAKAKTQAAKSVADGNELMERALEAFRGYAGQNYDDGY